VKLIVIAGVLGAVLTAGAVEARPANEAATHWRGLAEVDGRFALKLIEDNHPGAVVAVGDKDFQAQLQTARLHFAERLPQVESFEGYSALMAGMAADFRDGHIWSRASTQPGGVSWTGLVLGRRDGAWVVLGQEEAAGYAPIKGARLESCDGEAGESWAARRIGLFKADPAVEAQLANAGGWLLLDQGNPFLKRPDVCVFRTSDDVSQSVALRWRREDPETVGKALAAVDARASVGLSVDQIGEGYWISLGTLGAGAADLAARVEGQAEELRRASWVVVDLRGNGGGNSTISDRITRALVGDERIGANRKAPACSGAHFRASEGNIEALRGLQDRIRRDRGDEGAAEWATMVAEMQAARNEGQDFWPALPECAQGSSVVDGDDGRPVADAPASAMNGRLIVLTDRYCFSSCLMAVDLLRRVGAEQVGEATDVSTRYMEVRTVTLPSGLRNFSTLMKLGLGLDDFGPYAPERTYAGDLSDTDGVRAWVIEEVLGR
jgi:hypothetical protein